MEAIDITHPSDRIAVVELHGEHDCVTRHAFAELLDREVSSHDIIVVDVSDALFVDSSFVQNLMRADRAATARGSRLVLQMGTAPIVRTVLRVTGLLDYLEVAHSREEAVSIRTCVN